MKKKCELCQKSFKSYAGGRFCGSKTKKGDCKYIRKQYTDSLCMKRRIKKINSSPELKEKSRTYIRNYMRNYKKS